ncbi:MAG: tetratricopeptide repeat protein [Gammaproteobacteria bacterium]
MDGIIQNITKSGKKPKEQTLVLVQNACTKSGDNNCLQRTYEQLVTYYPKPVYWQNLVDAMYKTQSPGGNNDKNMLQVYRLASAVDVLKKASDFTEYAQLALEAGAAGEAQAVLEKGFTNKIFVEKRDVDRNQRLLESAKKQAATDPAKATSGGGAAHDADVSVGLAYLGAEQYDKAVEAINRSLSKNPQNPDARLTLGIAELKAGHKDEARKAFKAVKGDPTLERLANLWTLHSQA